MGVNAMVLINVVVYQHSVAIIAKLKTSRTILKYTDKKYDIFC